VRYLRRHDETSSGHRGGAHLPGTEDFPMLRMRKFADVEDVIELAIPDHISAAA
jgi:hypothetical protein